MLRFSCCFCSACIVGAIETVLAASLLASPHIVAHAWLLFQLEYKVRYPGFQEPSNTPPGCVTAERFLNPECLPSPTRRSAGSVFVAQTETSKARPGTSARDHLPLMRWHDAGCETSPGGALPRSLGRAKAYSRKPKGPNRIEQTNGRQKGGK